MRMLKPLAVVSIIGSWWCSSVCQEPIPVDPAAGRYELPGYSVLAPPGKDWYMAPAEAAGPSTVMFLKKPSRRSLQTAFVSVSSTPIEEADSTPEKLLERVKSELGVVEDPERFRTVSTEAALTVFHDVTCAQSRSTQEDHAAEGYGRKVAILEATLIFCPHPASARMLVVVSVSQRYPAKEGPTDLSAEIRPFLDSLRFTNVGP